MSAIVVQTQSVLGFHNLSCFTNQRKCKNPIFSTRDVPLTWSVEGKDIRLTVSCVGSDGVGRDRPMRRRKARNDQEDEKSLDDNYNDIKHNSSSQEDIIAIFRRIQSSISKDDPINYNPKDSQEKSPAASILKVLGESGKKQGRAKIEKVNNNYARKRSVTKKDKRIQDHARVTDPKSKRPQSKFVKRSPIPYPTSPRGLALELTVDGAEEEEELVEPARLETMKLSQLKELAKSRGIKGYSKLKKSELINLLKSSIGVQIFL